MLFVSRQYSIKKINAGNPVSTYDYETLIDIFTTSYFLILSIALLAPYLFVERLEVAFPIYFAN